MAVNVISEEGQAIRKLIPLSTIPSTHFEVLCEEIKVEKASRNSFLFRRGDTSGELYYLLNGEVSLQSMGLEVEIIKAGSDSARFAIAHQNPKKIDAVAISPVRFLRLKTDTLNYLLSLTYEEESSSMVIVEPEENSADWMTTLLKSPIFQRLPPANLQKILMMLEEVVVEKGEVIIRQGETGDYYYLIKEGQCLLTRKPTEHAKEIKLALLRASDNFGEDSLLSGNPRNVTITALTKTSLLRLSKEHFISLIKEPTLKFVDYEQMCSELEQGSILLDVRSSEDYKINHIAESINTPFFTLRMQLKTLNRAKPVIVVCSDGKTSEAAAFLLLRNKFKASILKGGMNEVGPEHKKSAASFEIDDGFETTFASSTDEHEEQENRQEAKTELSTELIKENEHLKQENANLIQKLNELHEVNTELTNQNKILQEKLKNIT